jgi:hypothetical protein
MTKFLRLSLIAAALGAPLCLAAPAGANSAAVSGLAFEEVAAAPSGTSTRAQRRTRRPSAQATRRHRQSAQRTRRARAAQG